MRNENEKGAGRSCCARISETLLFIYYHGQGYGQQTHFFFVLFRRDAAGIRKDEINVCQRT